MSTFRCSPAPNSTYMYPYMYVLLNIAPSYIITTNNGVLTPFDVVIVTHPSMMSDNLM